MLFRNLSYWLGFIELKMKIRVSELGSDDKEDELNGTD